MIYSGDVRGAEREIMAVCGETPLSGNLDINHWTLRPERSSEGFDFDRDIAAMDDALAADVNAMNPDLSRFAARAASSSCTTGGQTD